MAAPLPCLVECPHCSALLSLDQPGEWQWQNCWTDGKNFGWPLAGFKDELFRCESCAKFFWQSIAMPSRTRAYERGIPIGHPKREKALSCPYLDAELGFAERAIEEGFANDRAKEINLRIRILWS